MRAKFLALLLAAAIPAALPGDGRRPATGPRPPAAAPVVMPAPDPYETPATAIDAPANPARGRLVVLSARPFSQPAGLIGYTYVWVVSPRVDGVLHWPDGSKVAFGSGLDGDPAHYDVTLVATYLFADKDGKNPVLRTVEATAAVDIAPRPGPTPPPPPPPGPQPPKPQPDPTVPDGRFKIAPIAYELAKAHPAEECRALARAYRTLAASKVGTKAELVNLTLPAIHDALGASVDAWSTDLTALANKVNELHVVPAADCKALYTEIATGLEARR
jgi:hypothetical protein